MNSSNPEAARGEAKDGAFTGKLALIFGGAKGIGRSVAIEWARRGARLAIADIDQAAAVRTAADIEAAGGEAIGLPADVLREESIIAAAEEAEHRLGEVDILMSNVGAIVNGHPEDIPLMEWERMTELNYWGTLRATKHFLPKFLERGRGHFVNTASFAGLYPYAASRMPYVSAKAAILALSQSLALYLEPQGIRVSCLIPGPVLTDVRDSMTSWTDSCPMRGPGSELELKLPEEVAVTLSDGMHDGAILIPSDPKAWDILRRWAESPDAFLRAKIAEFAAGDVGAPRVPEPIRRMLANRK
jgi:NAD(P)-dependent dehydrogenase (short-subunit alcohol dehydrogenase family)